MQRHFYADDHKMEVNEREENEERLKEKTLMKKKSSNCLCEVEIKRHLAALKWDSSAERW